MSTLRHSDVQGFQVRRASLADVREAVSRMPLALNGFEGEARETDRLGRVKEGVFAALALGERGYVRHVMADLQQTDPSGWVEVGRFLEAIRALTPR